MVKKDIQKYNVIDVFYPSYLFACQMQGKSHTIPVKQVLVISFVGIYILHYVIYCSDQVIRFGEFAVGGLLNATCGNATELIIAIFALYQRKISVLKYSLLGSILSNLLLVRGSSLFIGGIANLSKAQRFDRV